MAQGEAVGGAAWETRSPICHHRLPGAAADTSVACRRDPQMNRTAKWCGGGFVRRVIFKVQLSQDTVDQKHDTIRHRQEPLSRRVCMLEGEIEGKTRITVEPNRYQASFLGVFQQVSFAVL